MKNYKKQVLKILKGCRCGDPVIYEYALEIFDGVDVITSADLEDEASLERCLLNGATDWSQYSFGGLSLVYNVDLANRLGIVYNDLEDLDGCELLEMQANYLEQAFKVYAMQLFFAIGCGLLKVA